MYDSGCYAGGEALGIAWCVARGGAGGFRAAGARGAGREFSHWIPDRALRATGSRWLRRGLGRSLWNGNSVPAAEHALTDPFRYRFMPRAWKALNPIRPASSRQWGRVPLVYKGATAGAAYGLGAVQMIEWEQD